MFSVDLSKKQKIGFVCSGGAVKAAAFHVGVAMALEHRGLRFQGGIVGANSTEDSDPASSNTPQKKPVSVYVGSSAGSLVTTFLAQGGNLKDLQASFFEKSEADGLPALKYWEMLFPRVRTGLDFFSLDNFLLGMVRKKSVQSPFTTHGIAKYLKNYVIRTDKFQDLEASLCVVATEVNQSRKVVFGKSKVSTTQPHVEYRNDVAISDACAASMALPPIYHPYTIQIEGQNRDYFDGEIREPLSSHIAKDMGCDLIICSYTHQPLRIPSGKGSIADKGIQSVTLQAIYQSIEQKIQSARGFREKEKNLIDTVWKFFDSNDLPKSMAEKLVNELESRMNYNSNVDYIYIRPKPTDEEMFTLPHFSLKKHHTEQIAKKGFFAAMQATRGLVSKLD
jgi:predicted acylesterase/phospholipase RssA